MKNRVKKFDLVVESGEIGPLLVALALIRKGWKIGLCHSDREFHLPLYLPRLDQESSWDPFWNLIGFSRSDRLLFSPISPLLQIALPGRVLEVSDQNLFIHEIYRNIGKEASEEMKEYFLTRVAPSERVRQILSPILIALRNYRAPSLSSSDFRQSVASFFCGASTHMHGTAVWRASLIHSLLKHGAISSEGAIEAKLRLTQEAGSSWIENGIFRINKKAIPSNMAHQVYSIRDLESPLIDNNLIILSSIQTQRESGSIGIVLARHLSQKPTGRPEGLLMQFHEHLPHLYSAIESIPSKTQSIEVTDRTPLPSGEIPLLAAQYLKEGIR